MISVAPRPDAASRATGGWPALILATLIGFAAVLAGCSSAPLRSTENLPAGSWPGRDGAEPHPPSGLEQVPDATPQVETIRPGGPNKPYDVLGRSYVPITRDTPYTERGIASWYGRFFHGKRTASGEVYNMYAMTAAHPTLPIPSYARVRNPANGREVIVRINDRGPFHTGRIIDLSYTAATRLGLAGVGNVEVERITFDDIRTGAWRRDGGGSGSNDAVLAAATPALVPDASAPGSAATAITVAPSSDAPSAATVDSVAAGVTPVSTTDSSSVAPVLIAAVPNDLPAAAPIADPSPAAAAPARAYTAAARGFWLQLGAFRQREGAVGFQQRVAAQLEWLAPQMALFSDPSLYRLQAGPFPTRDDARAAAERIRVALNLVTVVVERR